MRHKILCCLFALICLFLLLSCATYEEDSPCGCEDGLEEEEPRLRPILSWDKDHGRTS